MLHQFLVSTSERYRLKLYILGRSFDLGTRFLLQSTERVVRGEPESEREWEQMQAIRHDFQPLTDESLEGLKQPPDVAGRRAARRPPRSVSAARLSSAWAWVDRSRSTRSISGRWPGVPCVSRTTPTPGAIHSTGFVPAGPQRAAQRAEGPRGDA